MTTKISSLRQNLTKEPDLTIQVVLLFMLALIPITVHPTKLQFASPVISVPWLNSGLRTDVFSYYKFILLLTGTLIVLGFFLYKMIKRNYLIPKGYINIPLAVMFLAILISGVIAQYHTLGIMGLFNRHDGTLSFLSYLLLCFIGANTVVKQKNLEYLKLAFYPMILISAILALIAFYGYNVANSSFFKTILFFTPNVTLNAGATFVTTLANPNYLSGAASIYTALFCVYAIYAEGVRERIVNTLLAILSFSMLLTSLSSSGFVSFVIVFVLILGSIFFSKRQRAKTVSAITLIVLLSLTFLVFNYHNPNVWKESVGNFADLGNYISSKLTSDGDTQQPPKAPQTDKGSSQALASSPGTAAPELDALPPSAFGPGTGRLYIWQKTWDLVKLRPLFGYGLDTLSFYFPQDDIAKKSNLNDASVVVDKPHSLYLDIAFGSGLIAFLAFLALIVIHALKNINILRRGIESSTEVAILALFTAWLAFLLQGLFNDSTIGTSVVFWIMMGFNISLLRQVQRK